MVVGWWLALALTPLKLAGWPAVLAQTVLLLLPAAAMSLRWRSIRLGVYSVVAWNVYAWSLIPGFLRRRAAPTSWIESTVIKEQVPLAGSMHAAKEAVPKTGESVSAPASLQSASYRDTSYP
jgi:hypothetical protein